MSTKAEHGSNKSVSPPGADKGTENKTKGSEQSAKNTGDGKEKNDQDSGQSAEKTGAAEASKEAENPMMQSWLSGGSKNDPYNALADTRQGKN